MLHGERNLSFLTSFFSNKKKRFYYPFDFGVMELTFFFTNLTSGQLISQRKNKTRVISHWRRIDQLKSRSLLGKALHQEGTMCVLGKGGNWCAKVQ